MSIVDYPAKQAYQRGLKWLVGSAVFAVVGVGGVLGYDIIQNRPPAPISAEVIPVKLGDVENRINEGGILELGGQRSIKSPEDGAVENILVQVGDRVTQGQQLMSLRNPNQQTILQKKQLDIQKQEIIVERHRQEVTEAEEQLAAAQRQLQIDQAQYQQELASKKAVKDLTIQRLESQVNRNRQKVEEAEIELAAAEEKLASSRELLERGFVAQQEIERGEESVRQQTTALRNAKHDLNTTLMELASAKAELITVSTTVNTSPVVESEIRLRQAKTTLRQSLSELERLQIEYQEEALKLQNFVITSPINGVVLNINVKAGDGLNRGHDLITLGDPNQEIVRLQLSTLNAVQVRQNQLARITEIGPNPEVFIGRVDQVDLATRQSEGNQDSGSGQASVFATVKLDRPTGRLIPGSPVSVEIVLNQRENVVVLNTELIQRDRDSRYVWVLDDNNTAQKQPVTLGLEGLIEVEITSGLNSGDLVISPPFNQSLEPGKVIVHEPQ